MKTLLHNLLHRLAHEPVAVWGVVLAAVLGLLPLVGVSTSVITIIGAVASLLGVPVVRSKVTPIKALVDLGRGHK